MSNPQPTESHRQEVAKAIASLNENLLADGWNPSSAPPPPEGGEGRKGFGYYLGQGKEKEKEREREKEK